MKVSSLSVSMSGTTPMAVEISAPRPTLAPSNRYQNGAYTVAYTPCSTCMLATWIWLASHLRQYMLPCTGQQPALRRGNTAQRMAAAISAVPTTRMALAGNASSAY